MVTNTFTKNDTQTLMTAYTDGLINYGMTAGLVCTALSCYPAFVDFLEKFSLKQIQNAIGRIKKAHMTPEDLHNSEMRRLSTQNQVTEAFGKFFF
jgi:hypothetical protein